MSHSLHNSLSFLKSANTSNSSLERVPSARSRSGSFLRAISLHSPHPSSTPNTETYSPTVTLSRTNTTGSTVSSLSRIPSMTDESAESMFSCNPEDIELRNPIGYGSSAVVYNAIYKPKNMRIAVKMIDLDLFERNQIDELRRETALMALSKHPNVLRVCGSFVSGSKLYIATPYLSGGSCLDIMKNGFQDGFDEIVIVTILKQALEGLVYLHKNGHIHRDVKAGNLLMDNQGTVLLADFGVSSSLTENNEVRKTFVGTPCWMAPEVMEQSSYDFKADIWSFGITAIELATGHAPFAKFPPMKVLMMTLNDSPPTLNREHAKHKFSRAFKEVVDLCLQKDPNKRPSAEKLLHHPFFKQAKKREFLVRSVLTCVPPLDQRVHKKMAHKEVTIEDTAQWDFEEDEHKVDPKFKDNDTPTKKHISFGNAIIKNEMTDLPSPALSSELEISSPIPVRKSRFVVEDNIQSLDKNESTVSSQRSLSLINPSMHHKSQSNADATAKSYFNDISPHASISPNNSEHNWQSIMGLGLGISSTSTAAMCSLQQQQDYSEVKKGRFSVNQSNLPAIRTTNIGIGLKGEQTPVQGPESPYITSSPSMSRIASNDSMRGERKSRFEVQHMPAPPTPQTTISHFVSTPIPSASQGIFDHQYKSELPALSREGSTHHQRNLSRDSVNSSKVSRFSIEKENSNTTHQSISTELFYSVESTYTPVHNECRKKGRFELTGGMTSAERLDSPAHLSEYQIQHPTNQPQDLPPSIHEHIEALIKQAEIQKTMIQDLLFGLTTTYYSNVPHNKPVSRARSSSFESRKTSTPVSNYQNGLLQLNNSHTIEPTKSAQNDIALTMENLRRLLIALSQEKDRLLLENEAMKKEIETIRKQQLPPSTSTNNIPSSPSILKTANLPKAAKGIEALGKSNLVQETPSAEQ